MGQTLGPSNPQKVAMKLYQRPYNQFINATCELDSRIWPRVLCSVVLLVKNSRHDNYSSWEKDSQASQFCYLI